MRLPHSGTTKFFSKRAVLRIGMLLRDSEVAMEIRHQLLNTFENSTPEQQLKEIDAVKSISDDFFQSLMSGDTEGAGKAMVALSAHKDRHIAVLKKENEVVTAENEQLTSRNEVLVVENDVDFEETIDSCALNIDD